MDASSKVAHTTSLLPCVRRLWECLLLLASVIVSLTANGRYRRMYDLQTLGSKSSLSTPSSMSGPESKLPSPMYNTPMSQDMPESDDELNNVAASRDYEVDERKPLIIDADGETVGEKVVLAPPVEAEKVREMTSVHPPSFNAGPPTICFCCLPVFSGHSLQPCVCVPEAGIGHCKHCLVQGLGLSCSWLVL
jgi:hypothetical protein